MPGPAPKDPSTVARRNKRNAGFRQLPAGGRRGRTPPWPLDPDIATEAALGLARARVAKWSEAAVDGATPQDRAKARTALDVAEGRAAELALRLETDAAAELALWRELWRAPVAVVWQEAAAERVVAMYARWTVRAEQCDPKAAIEARLLGDRLGVSPLALMRLRCAVDDADAATARGRARRATAPPAAVVTDGRPPVDPREYLRAVQ